MNDAYRMTSAQHAADRAEVESDLELLARARDGDSAAFGALFDRHRAVALRTARRLIAGAEAEDVVAEAFARVFRQVVAGQGPREDFKSYVLTTVRHEATRFRDRADRHQAFAESVDLAPTVVAPVGAEEVFDQEAIRRAYAVLPERWRHVLWLLDVEGRKPREIAARLDSTPSRVHALAYRARGALREAYLDQHLASSDSALDPACRSTRQAMARVVRERASRRRQERVRRHIEHCRDCAVVHAELVAVDERLGAALTPGVALTGLAGLGFWGTSAVTAGSLVLAHPVIAAVVTGVLALALLPAAPGDVSEPVPAAQSPAEAPERSAPLAYSTESPSVSETREAEPVQERRPTAPAVPTAAEGSQADQGPALVSPGEESTVGGGRPAVGDEYNAAGSSGHIVTAVRERDTATTIDDQESGPEPLEVTTLPDGSRRVVESRRLETIEDSYEIDTAPADESSWEEYCDSFVHDGMTIIVTTTVERRTETGHIVRPDGTKRPFVDVIDGEPVQTMAAVPRIPPFECLDDPPTD